MSEIQIKQIHIHKYKALSHVSNKYNVLLLFYRSPSKITLYWQHSVVVAIFYISAITHYIHLTHDPMLYVDECVFVLFVVSLIQFDFIMVCLVVCIRVLMVMVAYDPKNFMQE